MTQRESVFPLTGFIGQCFSNAPRRASGRIGHRGVGGGPNHVDQVRGGCAQSGALCVWFRTSRRMRPDMVGVLFLEGARVGGIGEVLVVLLLFVQGDT